ncbi:hypothetical protein [Pseudomonas sp. AAC]|uniref:hypothetical protein n=1 Tax=Pseudomonas sp. AAC TaxID=1502784 RepID=UPI00210A5BD5|nr:hypothetical protein [Pseudomonas sp. AAC]
MPRISAGNAGGKNVCAFLDMLAWSESARTSRFTKGGGYDVAVGGTDSPNTFSFSIASRRCWPSPPCSGIRVMAWRECARPRTYVAPFK